MSGHTGKHGFGQRDAHFVLNGGQSVKEFPHFLSLADKFASVSHYSPKASAEHQSGRNRSKETSSSQKDKAELRTSQTQMRRGCRGVAVSRDTTHYMSRTKHSLMPKKAR